MAKHAGPPEPGADDPAERSVDNLPGRSFSQDFEDEAYPASALPPARFGRLALWIASASALTVGVMATLAYGVWFDQDQRAYVKAMTVAQQTLSSGVAAVPRQQTRLSGAAIVPDQRSASINAALVPAPQSASINAAVVPDQQSASINAPVVSQQPTLSSGKAVVSDQQGASLNALAVPQQQTLSSGEAVTSDQQTPSLDAAAVVPEPQAVPANTATLREQQTAWTGHVAPASPPLAPATTLAAADLTTSASSAQPAPIEAVASDSFAPRSNPGKCATPSCGMKPVRHRPTPRTKPDNGLLARMESLFHRANYGQRGNGSQRDLYDHS
ncbi:hypothetical protein P3T43_000110 [Paraburkholderia sp. GAS41]|jgi:hypothetical protein